MVLQLHKNYRLYVTPDRMSFVLSHYQKGFNKRTNKIGEGRWIREGYFSFIGAIEKYVDDRLKDKVGGERNLIEPKEILEELTNIKTELENTFNIPVEKVIPKLKPEDVPRNLKKETI